MKILASGASGYIGSHGAAVFADAGHGVSALHRPGGAPPPARYSRVGGDLAEPGSLTAAATGYDRVIHAGAPIDDSTDRAGAEALLSSGSPVLYTTGAAVLGPGAQDEDSAADPHAIATALGSGTAASWPVSEASTELGLLADLFTRDQDVSAAKTRAGLGWAPAWTSIVKYLTA